MSNGPTKTGPGAFESPHQGLVTYKLSRGGASVVIPFSCMMYGITKDQSYDTG
jgi:hypothetical protein